MRLLGYILQMSALIGLALIFPFLWLVYIGLAGKSLIK